MPPDLLLAHLKVQRSTAQAPKLLDLRLTPGDILHLVAEKAPPANSANAVRTLTRHEACGMREASMPSDASQGILARASMRGEASSRGHRCLASMPPRHRSEASMPREDALARSRGREASLRGMREACARRRERGACEERVARGGVAAHCMGRRRGKMSDPSNPLPRDTDLSCQPQDT